MIFSDSMIEPARLYRVRIEEGIRCGRCTTRLARSFVGTKKQPDVTARVAAGLVQMQHAAMRDQPVVPSFSRGATRLAPLPANLHRRHKSMRAIQAMRPSMHAPATDRQRPSSRPSPCPRSSKRSDAERTVQPDTAGPQAPGAAAKAGSGQRPRIGAANASGAIVS